MNSWCVHACRRLMPQLVLPAFLLAFAASAQADVVKITPLGSHAGEFCPLDRALLFEDPDGTRILYDPGRTVAGADDPRLGRIDAVLVSHLHGDHVGDRHLPSPGAGTCAAPEFSQEAFPHSNAVAIAAAKSARIVTGSEMPTFFASRLTLLGADPALSTLARFGATRTVGGVLVSTVPASHSNGVDTRFIGGELQKLLDASGLRLEGGPATGYVLRFSNGLTAYLSGDTGMTAEQDAVVRGYYGAKLAVINISDTFVTGPKEAAYVINTLVRPAAVIASHANEVATERGQLRPQTRTAAFVSAVSVPVHLPLSGRTMTFDTEGVCQDGCTTKAAATGS